jgi:hypothetical protein
VDLSDFSGTGPKSVVMVKGEGLVVKDDFCVSPGRFGRAKNEGCVMSEERLRRRSVVIEGKRRDL